MPRLLTEDERFALIQNFADEGTVGLIARARFSIDGWLQRANGDEPEPMRMFCSDLAAKESELLDALLSAMAERGEAIEERDATRGIHAEVKGLVQYLADGGRMDDFAYDELMSPLEGDEYTDDMGTAVSHLWLEKHDEEVRAAALASRTVETAEETGASMIAAERATHPARGYDAEHDVEHWRDLLKASIAYVWHALGHRVSLHELDQHRPLEPWPWARGYWKPRGRIRTLVKAGALIAASIDSLIAAGEPVPTTTETEERDRG